MMPAVATILFVASLATSFVAVGAAINFGKTRVGPMATLCVTASIAAPILALAAGVLL